MRSICSWAAEKYTVARLEKGSVLNITSSFIIACQSCTVILKWFQEFLIPLRVRPKIWQPWPWQRSLWGAWLALITVLCRCRAVAVDLSRLNVKQWDLMLWQSRNIWIRLCRLRVFFILLCHLSPVCWGFPLSSRWQCYLWRSETLQVYPESLAYRSIRFSQVASHQQLLLSQMEISDAVIDDKVKQNERLFTGLSSKVLI